MASNPIHSSSSVRVGASKAQAGLAKIIAVISTIRPPLIPPLYLNGDGDSVAADAKVGFGVDLNLRLGSLPETGGGSVEENEGPTAYSGVVDPLAPAESADVSNVLTVEDTMSPAESVAGDAPTAEKSSEGECDTERVEREEDQKKLEEEGAKEISEIIKDDEKVETNKRGNGSEGYLDLLLEAVRQVSGGVFDDEPGKEKLEPSPPPMVEVSGRRIRSKRRRMSWSTPLDFCEDSAPVVRSKRGRNQALPSRYRDSVLDPWRKLPTINRHERTAKP